jgi:hypothetical protein
VQFRELEGIYVAVPQYLYRQCDGLTKPSQSDPGTIIFAVRQVMVLQTQVLAL